MHRFREQLRVSLLLSIESTTETRRSGKIPRELPLTAKRDRKEAKNVPTGKIFSATLAYDCFKADASTD